jgi:hypothetical protein
VNRPAVPILLWASLQFIYGAMLLIWSGGGTVWLLLIASGVLTGCFAIFVDPPRWLVRRTGARRGAVLAALAVAAILVGLFAGQWLVIIGALVGIGSLVLLTAETRAAK